MAKKQTVLFRLMSPKTICHLASRCLPAPALAVLLITSFTLISTTAGAIETNNASAAPANKMFIPKLTDRSKAGIMAYFRTVIENQRVIVGQQCSESADVALNYKISFQSLYESTGKHPALLGLEYGYFANANLPANNQYAIAHWKKGGLVTISWHADNPFKEGYNVRFDSAQEKKSINLRSLLKNAPDSTAKTSYRAELRRIAGALKQLKDAGVIVLWRPFHEVNGNWFWWGVNDWKKPNNQEDFAALWKDMRETFTTDFGLDNLLWVYSPSSSKGHALPPLEAMFPGAPYVDIVAVDSYGKSPDFNDYEALKKFGKLIANGEIGPNKDGYGSFDQMEVLNIFKGKAAYFLQWHSWGKSKVAIVDNLRCQEMMNNPAAITLDKLK